MALRAPLVVLHSGSAGKRGLHDFEKTVGVVGVHPVAGVFQNMHLQHGRAQNVGAGP